MPMISMIVSMCSEIAAVPYQILSLTPLSKPFRVGFAMNWPLHFNLVLDPERFSRKYNLPYVW